MTFDSPEDGPGSGSASIGAISPAIVALEGLLPPAPSAGLGTSAPAPSVEQNMAFAQFQLRAQALRARPKFPSYPVLFSPLCDYFCD
jgi:hypothetical protein